MPTINASRRTLKAFDALGLTERRLLILSELCRPEKHGGTVMATTAYEYIHELLCAAQRLAEPPKAPRAVRVSRAPDTSRRAPPARPPLADDELPDFMRPPDLLAAG
jgi:hypothetical protein